jgi:hypothetical protein
MAIDGNLAALDIAQALLERVRTEYVRVNDLKLAVDIAIAGFGVPHETDGTRIRLKLPSGAWGAWVDLGANLMRTTVYDTDGDGKVDVAELAESVAWSNVSGKPGTFPATAHGHSMLDIAGLAAAFAAKAEAIHGHIIDDVSGLQTALNGKANSSHTHSATQIIDASPDGRSILTAANFAAIKSLLEVPSIPSIPTKAVAAEVRTGTDDAKFLTAKAIRDAMAYVALTDAATIAVDMGAGFNFILNPIGGNRTLGAPTNSIAGQSGAILIIQDGTGSRTLGYNTAWKFSGTTPVLSTAPNAVDLLTYLVTTGGGSPILRANLLKGFA